MNPGERKETGSPIRLRPNTLPYSSEASPSFNPEVSWFTRATENLPEKDIKLCEFIKDIRNGRYRSRIEAIRQRFTRALLRTNGDRAAAKKTVDWLKKQLPAVTVSGVFGIRANDQLQKHSGLIQADLDLLSDRLAEVRTTLRQDPSVCALFLSPTGDGLKAIYRVPVCTNQSQHELVHNSVSAHVRELCGVIIDSTNDVSRLCYASYDPEPLLNPVPIELAVQVGNTREGQPLNDKPGSEQHDPTLRKRARIAEEILGVIRWENLTTGFCECPGRSKHTNANGEKDCKVWLAGVPSIYCQHKSCASTVDSLNHELRSRIGKAERKDTIDNRPPKERRTCEPPRLVRPPDDGQSLGIILPGNGVSITETSTKLYKLIAPTHQLFIRGKVVVSVCRASTGTLVLEPVKPSAARSLFEKFSEFMAWRSGQHGAIVLKPTVIAEETARAILDCHVAGEIHQWASELSHIGRNMRKSAGLWSRVQPRNRVAGAGWRSTRRGAARRCVPITQGAAGLL
jgi:hypothetical protein